MIAIAALIVLGVASTPLFVVNPIVAVEIPTETRVQAMSAAYRCKLLINGSERTVYASTIREVRFTHVAGEVSREIINGVVRATVYFHAPALIFQGSLMALSGPYIVPVKRLYYAKPPCSDLLVTVPYGEGLSSSF